MRGIICYYSGSGNTKLAVEKIIRSIPKVRFHLVDIRLSGSPDFTAFDLAGFATFTDFWGVPKLMEDFIRKCEGKPIPTFVLNTFGMISGRTLLRLQQLASSRGFQVFTGFSLHTPESYPPMIARGLANEQAPNQVELERFDKFVEDLQSRIEHFGNSGPIGKKTVQAGFWSHLLPAFARTKARRDMGEKFVDESLCTRCNHCQRGCPYKAIRLAPYPVFDMTKCYGCWACFNQCPTKAIYTRKIRGQYHYPTPLPALVEKLST